MTPDLCISFREHPLVKQPKELTDRSMCCIVEAKSSSLLTVSFV